MAAQPLPNSLAVEPRRKYLSCLYPSPVLPFMWPFSSSYLTVVSHKRDQRARALETAGPSTAEHAPFIEATGKLSTSSVFNIADSVF
jgi:hypothetical protein